MTETNDTLAITRESLLNLIQWFSFMTGYTNAHKDYETSKSLATVMVELEKVVYAK